MKLEEVQNILVEAGVLPSQIPSNFTYDKVRALLEKLTGYDVTQIQKGIASLQSLGIRYPLGAVIYLVHFLEGDHTVEVDRVTESEEGARYGVLAYPEGELPIPADKLPAGIRPGSSLNYVPDEKQYVLARKKAKAKSRKKRS